MKKVIAVFGYNNTRIYDLHKIRDIARNRFDAELLLVKEGITEADGQVASYCLDRRPEDTRLSGPLRELLGAEGLELIACLPFSDKGVIGAAHAARDLGLFGDDASTSFAMLDKSLFRSLEAEIPMPGELYKKPFFEVAHSESELRDLLASHGKYFLKPTSEGNSRGCMKITGLRDLERWLSENPTALKFGVICEEILSDSGEYSFDGVDGAYWITQKFTTRGSYRAEYQQIVPAPWEPELAGQIHGTLPSLLQQLGSRGGAFHHEFFLLGDDRVASVEPNRRPAGMWIWDLAAWAFKDFDPWTRWLEKCAGVSCDETAPKQACFAGVRGVISRQDGKLAELHQQRIERELSERFGAENLRISFLKPVGEAVRSEPRDNSDFLAFIALKNDNYHALVAGLDEANDIFLKNAEVMS